MFGNFSRSPQEDYIATLRELRLVSQSTGSLDMLLALNNATEDNRAAVSSR